MIVHLLDIAPPDGSDPADNYRKIREELSQYSPLLAEKQEIIALNKLDLLDEAEQAAAITSCAPPSSSGAPTRSSRSAPPRARAPASSWDKLWSVVNPKVEMWKQGAAAT